jgi:hypothetical protein
MREFGTYKEESGKHGEGDTYMKKIIWYMKNITTKTNGMFLFIDCSQRKIMSD